MNTENEGPVWNERALRVAKERFPQYDLESEYYAARLLPKKGPMKTRVKDACSKHDKKWIEEGFQGRYYKVSPKRLVFVVCAPELIIHVLSLTEIETAKKNREA